MDRCTCDAACEWTPLRVHVCGSPANVVDLRAAANPRACVCVLVRVCVCVCVGFLRLGKAVVSKVSATCAAYNYGAAAS